MIHRCCEGLQPENLGDVSKNLLTDSVTLPVSRLAISIAVWARGLRKQTRHPALAFKIAPARVFLEWAIRHDQYCLVASGCLFGKGISMLIAIASIGSLTGTCLRCQVPFYFALLFSNLRLYVSLCIHHFLCAASTFSIACCRTCWVPLGVVSERDNDTRVEGALIVMLGKHSSLSHRLKQCPLRAHRRSHVFQPEKKIWHKFGHFPDFLETLLMGLSVFS